MGRLFLFPDLNEARLKQSMLMQLAASVFTYALTYFSGASVVSWVRAGTVPAAASACHHLIGTACISLLLVLCWRHLTCGQKEKNLCVKNLWLSESAYSCDLFIHTKKVTSVLLTISSPCMAFLDEKDFSLVENVCKGSGNERASASWIYVRKPEKNFANNSISIMMSVMFPTLRNLSAFQGHYDIINSAFT